MKGLPITLMAALQIGCASGQGLGESEGLEAALNRTIPALLEETKTPGMVVAVIDPEGGSFSRGWGFADLETKAPLTERTPIMVASVSKSWGAWGVMRVVQEKGLDLDAPLSRYVKRWHLGSSQFDPREVTCEPAT